MASSDLATLSYKAESTYGTQPTGQFKDVRFTSESLRGRVNSVRSREIRSDRQTSDVMRVGIGAEGAVEFELSHKTFDDWLVALIGSSGWSTVQTIVNNTTIQAITLGSQLVGTSNPFTNLVAGQWIRVTGFTTAQNNGVFKIASKPDDNTLNLNGATLVDEAAGDQISIRMGPQIVNGTTLPSYTIQRAYTDLTKYMVYRGCGINQLRLSGQINQLVTGSFDVLGITEEQASSDAASGSPAHVPADGLTGVGALFSPVQSNSGVFVGPSTLLDLPGALEMTQFDCTINANLRQRERIGALGSQSQGAGKIECSGSFRAYYNAPQLYALALDYTDVSVPIILEGDVDPNVINNPVYVIEFPACRLTPGDGAPAAGENQDVFASINFDAHRHPTEGVTVRIARIDAGVS